MIIVTWNRREMVSDVLAALARQSFPLSQVDVFVIDNAGSDGTLSHLRESFRPERTLHNSTERAHEPNFEWDHATGSDVANAIGCASLTVVRNAANLGGCGGFNTGFAFIEQASARGLIACPDYVWLVDDDIDLPSDALERLARVMESDRGIGLVGSRTCDIKSREITIETTIYFNRETGLMQDQAPRGHPRRDEFRAWKRVVGDVRGRGVYTGTMDVDVVSACSLLARWDAVVGGKHDAGRPPVGFWDARYFIYCDDADWCLRFGRAGWRVVLNLDAVVYHTPWNLKLTPARLYYATRNRLWMGQKVLDRASLRRATTRGVKRTLRESLFAALHRRVFHAHIMLDTLDDARSGKAGKTGSDGPQAMPVLRAIEACGATGADSRVGVVCNTDESVAAFAAMLSEIEKSRRIEGQGGPGPIWIPIVRDDVEDQPPASDAQRGSGRVQRYRHAWSSRLSKQLTLATMRLSCVVVIDQNNDLPMLLPGAPRWTIHLDSRRPAVAQIERDGLRVRARFLVRFAVAAWRALRWAKAIEPTPLSQATKYG